MRVSATTGLMDVYAGHGPCSPGPCSAAADGGPATEQFLALDNSAMTTDNFGNLFIAGSDLTIRKVDAMGNMTLIAGNYESGFSGDGGPAVNASFRQISALATDPAGNLYVADSPSGRIRMISTAGIITTIAGTGFYFDNNFNNTVTDNTPALAADIYPTGLAYSAGSIYVADPGKYTTVLRLELSTGNFTNTPFSSGPPLLDVTTLANGDNGPSSIAIDPSGTIYAIDLGLLRVLKLQDGNTTTYAGLDRLGDDGPAGSAFLNLPGGITLAGDWIYVSDTGNGYVRRIGPDSKIYGVAGTFDPYSLATDAKGDVFVGNAGSYIQKFSSDGGSPVTIAGQVGPYYSGDGGPATKAGLNLVGLASDGGANLYLDGGGRIRYIDASTGIITTFAGNGTQGDTGDGGPSANAEVYDGQIAVDKDLNVYLTSGADIRKISSLQITTIAGTEGSYGYSGDGGPAALATFNGTNGIAVDRAGNIYVADTGNLRVRKINTEGIIETIAGSGGFAPWTNDGPALQANLYPTQLAVDDYGNVYVSDYYNSRVVRLSPVAPSSTITVTGGNGQSADVFEQLPAPISVKVTDATGAGIAGVPIAFTSSPEGGATFSRAWILTGTDGAASTVVTLGAVRAPIAITATAPGLPPVGFSATGQPSFHPIHRPAR